MTSSGFKTSRIDRRNFLRSAAMAGGGAAVLAGSSFAMRGLASSPLSSQTTTTGGPDASTPMASPGASPVASPGASPVASPEAVTVREVAMVDIAFEVTAFTIPANTDIEVNLVNYGQLQHDFVIDELGVASDLLNGGETGSVTINAPAGEYQYYCSVPGHKEAGMVGTLTVV